MVRWQFTQPNVQKSMSTTVPRSARSVVGFRLSHEPSPTSSGAAFPTFAAGAACAGAPPVPTIPVPAIPVQAASRAARTRCDRMAATLGTDAVPPTRPPQPFLSSPRPAGRRTRYAPGMRVLVVDDEVTLAE